jgi:hypothetical protein
MPWPGATGQAMRPFAEVSVPGRGLWMTARGRCSSQCCRPARRPAPLTCPAGRTGDRQRDGRGRDPDRRRTRPDLLRCQTSRQRDADGHHFREDTPDRGFASGRRSPPPPVDLGEAGGPAPDGGAAVHGAGQPRPLVTQEYGVRSARSRLGSAVVRTMPARVTSPVAGGRGRLRGGPGPGRTTRRSPRRVRGRRDDRRSAPGRAVGSPAPRRGGVRPVTPFPAPPAGIR